MLQTEAYIMILIYNHKTFVVQGTWKTLPNGLIFAGGLRAYLQILD